MEPALAVAVIVEPTSTLPEVGLMVTLVTLIEPAAATRAPVELVKLEEPIFEDTLHLRYLPPKASVSSRVSPVAPAISVYAPLLVSELCHWKLSLSASTNAPYAPPFSLARALAVSPTVKTLVLSLVLTMDTAEISTAPACLTLLEVVLFTVLTPALASTLMYLPSRSSPTTSVAPVSPSILVNPEYCEVDADHV